MSIQESLLGTRNRRSQPSLAIIGSEHPNYRAPASSGRRTLLPRGSLLQRRCSRGTLPRWRALARWSLLQGRCSWGTLLPRWCSRWSLPRWGALARRTLLPRWRSRWSLLRWRPGRLGRRWWGTCPFWSRRGLVDGHFLHVHLILGLDDILLGLLPHPNDNDDRNDDDQYDGQDEAHADGEGLA